MIPEQTMILLSGIPATGKTSLARYLARNRGFTHYDLEHYPTAAASWIEAKVGC